MKALLINTLLHLLAALPLRLAQGVGSTLGWLLGQLQGDMGRITRINLERCLPELPARERDRLARASLVETGRTFAELGAMWLWRPERLLARVREVRGWELLEAAMAAGRGIIFLSPHLGAWELGSLYVAKRYPVTALYRPLRVPGLDALVRTARERTGATLMPTDASGVRSLYRALERGRRWASCRTRTRAAALACSPPSSVIRPRPWCWCRVLPAAAAPRSSSACRSGCPADGVSVSTSRRHPRRFPLPI